MTLAHERARENAPLLETDQTLCYDQDGNILPCAGTGQDASRPKRDPRGASRFQAHGEVVLDTATGAIWTRNANPAGFPLTWDEAGAFARDMADRNAYGRSGWQLPSRHALFSLVSQQRTMPALPSGHPFTNVFSGSCWTGDTCRRLPAQAWHVHIGGGRVPKANKSDSLLVWPVCMPQQNRSNGPENRFSLSGEQVTDHLTGLVWSRDADPGGRPLSWQRALSLVDEFNRARLHGAADWRMPNIRELESLVDLQAHSPALSPDHPFANVREVCWSSTTSVYEPRYAWALYTRDGMVGVGFKADAGFRLWLVRG